MRFYPTNRAIVLTLLIVVIMLFSSVFAVGNMFSTQQSIGNSNPVGRVSIGMENNVVFQLDQERFISFPVAPLSVDKSISKAYNGSISILITFSLTNQSRLNSLLSNLTNPESSDYHKYITRSEFAANFSVSPNLYGQAESYLSQYPGLKVRTYADRVSVEVTGPARDIGDLFNTSIVTNGSKGSSYFADSTPKLPESLAPYVSDVTGLSDAPMPLQYNTANKKVQLSQTKYKLTDNTYPQPVNSSGAQYIYGSDLQVAYDEQSLLNITYPTISRSSVFSQLAPVCQMSPYPYSTTWQAKRFKRLRPKISHPLTRIRNRSIALEYSMYMDQICRLHTMNNLF